ncbi:MAG: hypothetical protein NZV14_19435 [Bryobacteraceae bacterium]|nr:hypothetical protein [Bryobacteraceae bacterium]MDW8380339.1 hypothetical protein [Bryobacterales bacterium]
MKDAEVKQLLKSEGYPEHVWKGGKKGLVEKWAKFVEEVEAGYRLTLEDYRNDLDVRSLIARLGLDEEVAELDERFRRCLVFSAKAIWECDQPHAFWIYGYPKNARGELKKDLRAEGFLS